jgi:hypothetical protein
MLNFFKTQKDGVTVRLTSQRRLDHALLNEDIEDPALVTKLTIGGTMTKADFKYIHKKMSKTLQELDIFNATWEEGKLKKGVFARCIALTSIILPNWITEISECAFSNCISLKSITIPFAVTKIGELAFWGCTALTTVILPNSVTELEFRAFNNCTGLTSIVLPKSLVKIGGSAFGKCVALTSVTIPKSVIEIGNGTFAHCTGLDSIFIPKSVTKIGDWVFEGCNLAVTVDPDNPVYTVDDGKLITRFYLSIKNKNK